jgi:hypothetical protein
MASDHKKPGVVFWATVVLVVVVAYPLSFGPAVWAVNQDWSPVWALTAYERTYAPILWLYEIGPVPIRNALDWYAGFWR